MISLRGGGGWGAFSYERSTPVHRETVASHRFILNSHLGATLASSTCILMVDLSLCLSDQLIYSCVYRLHHCRDGVLEGLSRIYQVLSLRVRVDHSSVPTAVGRPCSVQRVLQICRCLVYVVPVRNVIRNVSLCQVVRGWVLVIKKGLVLVIKKGIFTCDLIRTRN